MEKEAPRCPSCGASISNRRYPKCEFCGEGLPESIAFTAEERRGLQQADDEAERVRADARAKDKGSRADGGFGGFEAGGGADGGDAGSGGD
jgi:hypothetical protein